MKILRGRVSSSDKIGKRADGTATYAMTALVDGPKILLIKLSKTPS
jgi:hypothetical protein